MSCLAAESKNPQILVLLWTVGDFEDIECKCQHQLCVCGFSWNFSYTAQILAQGNSWAQTRQKLEQARCCLSALPDSFCKFWSHRSWLKSLNKLENQGIVRYWWNQMPQTVLKFQEFNPARSIYWQGHAQWALGKRASVIASYEKAF